MNPFDLKSVLLAKHAQHVALVHFPIAPIFVSALFDLLSLRKQSVALLRAAYYTVVVAAISGGTDDRNRPSSLAMATGGRAYYWKI